MAQHGKLAALDHAINRRRGEAQPGGRLRDGQPGAVRRVGCDGDDGRHAFSASRANLTASVAAMNLAESPPLSG